MSGVYGTIRPANISVTDDVEIFYHYRPTRSTESDDFTNFQELDSSCLVETNADTSNGGTIPLLGVYSLRLPLDKFNLKGFYTIYIRPKEITTTITDVSVLAAYPSTKGVVFNSSTLGISDLTGYRIDYYDDNGNRTDMTRLITSSNLCEPVLVTISDSYPKATRYRLTDATSSKLLFCTVTPSSSASFRPNANPYIGTAGATVSISNTKFNPLLLEIEMVEHDNETLTYAIEGDQVRDRDAAIITTYNDEKDIYLQQDYFTVKDTLGTALRDVKRKRTNIDNSQDYDNVVTTDE